MQLEHLQLDLRPRANAQALDLGFSLLREHGRNAWLVWLALWLPWQLACLTLALLWPAGGLWWMLLAWWPKPLFERAPLYVLSRAVFGQQVSVGEALRAWPGQLRGGWFRLLTWWRVLMPGRGLYQPIWQLEGLRGRAASARRAVIGGSGAGAAHGYGIACVHFEVVLQIGLLGFLALFLGDESQVNPLRLFIDQINGEITEQRMNQIGLACWSLASAVIGPIYVASTFTLYLNRRATLEAWDVELMLRQLGTPAGARATASSQPARSATAPKPAAGAVAAASLLVLALGLPAAAPAHAADIGTDTPTDISKKTAPATPGGTLHCEAPKDVLSPPRISDDYPEHAAIRASLDAVYDHDDLRGWRCKLLWVPRDPQTETRTEARTDLPDLVWLADLFKLLVIAALILGLVWLLYRYRDQLVALTGGRVRPLRVRSIAGLDIRPESLPDDVAAEAARLWSGGQPRAALALIYRATLSRLVHDHGLAVSRGASEQDCLQLTRRQPGLSAGLRELCADCTGLWLRAAWAGEYPAAGQWQQLLSRWQQQFGQPETGA